MDDLTVTLRPEHARFADSEIAAGRSPDREAVVARALDALAFAADEADALDHWKALRLAELIETAEAAIARGEGVVVDDIAAYLDDLTAKAGTLRTTDRAA